MKIVEYLKQINWFDQDNKFNIVHFKFGKERKPITHYMKLGVIFRFALTAIAVLPGLNEEQIFNFIDEAQLHLNIDLLNDYIIKDTELLTYRIRRRIQQAIDKYNKENEN